MLSTGRGLQLGQTLQGTHIIPLAHTFFSGQKSRFFFVCLFILVSVPHGSSWPYGDTTLATPFPAAGTLSTSVTPASSIQVFGVSWAKTRLTGVVAYLRTASAAITARGRPRDDFFISGEYCSECRPGWSGGDCMKCGGVIHKKQGHLVLESYPNNARCEWTIQVDRPFAVELRFMMLSLEFHHSCQYDYVEVRDGDSISSRVIGRFCGNSRPPPVYSSGSSLHVLFVSDGYKNFDGFFATFQEISGTSSPCFHDGTCILDSSHTYRCACLGGYTGKNCEHVPVERVCVLPPKPDHGDHFLVYGPNDVLIALQYLCYQPYELSGTSQRTCLSNNTWSGNPPVCTKELQVNGKRDPDKVGPNDTKLRAVGGEVENTVEAFNTDYTENNTVTFETKERQSSNNSIRSPDKKRVPARVNVTQYTMYRAGGEESGGTVRNSLKKEDNKEKDPTEDGRRELEKEDKAKESEREANESFREKSCPPLPHLHHGYHRVVPGAKPEAVEFFCNHSYALSGDALRSCQSDGTWSGRQPVCVRACREPKVSELVRQRVLPPQAPFRKTPVHKLYSGLSPNLQSDSHTKGPPALSSLPQGFHQLYTHIEYECASQYYQHFGSSRRTCLKTGKWSGRHVSCSPVCGKHPTFDPERPADSHWPWLAAIYRRSNNRVGKKVTSGDGQTGSLKTDDGAGSGVRDLESDWQLVCSGVLVNQRSVVVAAHCVTELGKVYPLETAKLKVVVGKHFREDQREDKGPQHLRVDSIAVHENYDPHVLDSDVAVIRLLDKAKIGEKVAPLCLSDSQEDLETTSEQGLVTGWSPVPDPSLGPEEKARVGLVHLAHVVPCEQQYARNGVPVSVTDNMLCASQKPDYGSNICPSDMGGILILPPLTDSRTSSHRPSQGKGEDKGRWRLLGLVSFGYDQGECDPDLYTVYTHVANFKDWCGEQDPFWWLVLSLVKFSAARWKELAFPCTRQRPGRSGRGWWRSKAPRSEVRQSSFTGIAELRSTSDFTGRKSSFGV
ncbi:unnamed protein product [Tetraodon nigroviridis]|uniref:Inactive serine protease PAMR1 n=1 Tax=Tetraodon nigroviridis TaxID=99883 RepID=Q4SAF4_TETNG|nr:unnamed protein product [Tetraodon nigroviridis]